VKDMSWMNPFRAAKAVRPPFGIGIPEQIDESIQSCQSCATHRGWGGIAAVG